MSFCLVFVNAQMQTHMERQKHKYTNTRHCFNVYMCEGRISGTRSIWEVKCEGKKM